MLLPERRYQNYRQKQKYYYLYDCGQTGIVGHLGCIFSEIYENEIYHIATKHEFWGHEIAGIKLHQNILIPSIIKTIY